MVRKIDIIVIAVLVLLALGWFGWRMLREDSEALMYVVLVDGVEVASGMLDGSAFGEYETDGSTGNQRGIEQVNGKVVKQVNGQVIEQVNEQVIEAVNEQAIEPVSERVYNQVNTRANERVNEQTNGAPLLFSVPGRPAVLIRVADGKAAFHASDCPDQICVHTGYIASSGQSAACLPNGVILLIRGGAPGDAGGVDAVAVSDAVVNPDTVAEWHRLGSRTSRQPFR